MSKKLRLLPLVALVLLFALAIPVFALTASASQAPSLDLSRPASSHNVTVSSVQILEYYIGKALPDGEREYLTKHGGVSIKYDSGITTTQVMTDYDSGTLTVTAFEYTYTSGEGTEVTWIPDSVELNGETFALAQAVYGYTASLYNVPEDDALVASVNYKLDVTVPKDTLDRLLNLAVTDAPTVKARIEAGYAEYDRLYAEYEAGVIAYDEYLSALSKYEADYAAYTEYVTKKKLYDDAKAEYDEYLVALGKYESAMVLQREYEEAMEKYNAAYAEYTAYLAAVELYEKTVPEYEAYLRDIAVVREQLAVLNAAKAPMTDGRTLYNAIMGNTVTGVLENEDILSGKLMNVDRALITSAGDATDALREMLPEYFALTTEEEQYTYYKSHYVRLRDSFVTLLQALDELYNYKKVRQALKSQDATYPRKYEILVAQLAIISHGFTDGGIMSYLGDYEFTGNTVIDQYTVDGILENITYFDDPESAAPLENGYPVTIEEPVYPEKEVSKPTMPTAPSIPAKPDEVANPGDEPSEVECPTVPTPVSEPVKPNEFIPDAADLSLVRDYDAGRLEYRNESESGMTYTAVSTISKKLFNVTSVSVAFHDGFGNLIDRVSVDSGTRADFSGEIPTRAEDASAVYTFSGWVDSDGNDIDLSCVETDVFAYPKFDAAIKHYSITFDVDGKTTVLKVPYGSVPSLGYTPVRAADLSYEYEFAGWDREPVAVTGDAVYYARFDSIPVVPLVSLSGGVTGATVTSDSSYFYADCTATLTPTFDITKLIRLATASGTAKGIVINARYATVTLGYNTLLNMRAAGDSVVSLTVVKMGAYCYTYAVTVSDSDGSTADTEYRVTLRAPSLQAKGNGVRMYTLDSDGLKTPVSYTPDGDLVRFNAQTGITYYLAEEYAINIIQADKGTISVAYPEARPGDRVVPVLDMPPGISLDRLYIAHPDGTEEDITAEGFIMPGHAVTLSAAISYIEYTVTFTDGDTVLAVYRLRWGDKVSPPSPSRASDGKYRYVFLRWSTEVTDVTGDAVYDAVYERIPIPVKKDDGGLKVSASVMRLIVAAIVACAMLLLVVTPSAVISVVLIRRERKLYVKKADKKTK